MKNTIFLLGLLILLACANSKTENDECIEIDYKENMLNFGDIVERVELVPLETTDLALIKSPDNVTFFENRYYVTDRSQMSIFIFDAKGLFLNKIQNRGRGPKEYLYLSDFVIDKSAKQLNLLDGMRQSIFIYDLAGNYIETRKLPTLEGCTYMNLQYAKPNEIIFLTSDGKNLIKVYDKEKDVIQGEFFPEKESFSQKYLYGNNHVIVETSNIVYTCQENALKEAYRIEVKGLSPELKTTERPKKNDNKAQMEFRYSMLRSEIADYVLHEIRESFRYIQFSFLREEKHYDCLYDKSQKRSFVFNTLSKTRFSPMLRDIQDNCLVGLYYPIFRDGYKNILNAQDQAIIENWNEENNPILVKYIMKR